jgi:hypothetical protein
MIADDRNNENVENRNLIAKSIHIMLALNFYKEFETEFLKETELYYK